MDKIYRSQSNLFDQLQTVKTNYKKDGDSRKSEEYLRRRLAEIEAIWVEVVEADNNLKENFFDDNKAHQYWNERDSVRKLYQNVREDLEAKLQQVVATNPKAFLKPSSFEATRSTVAGIAGPSTTNSMMMSDETTNIRGECTRKYKSQDVKLRLCYKLMSDAQEILDAQGSMEQLKHKLHQIDAKIAQIDQLHEELLVDATPTDEATLAYFIEDHYATVSTTFEVLRARITEALSKATTKEPEKHEVQLKRIEIPQFHGDPLQWASFYDLFKRIVHENGSISDTIKMHQLKTTVVGAASRLINHLEATGDNYNDAWRLLVNRYQNKRQLVSNHVKTILDYTPVTIESAGAIRSLHDMLMESLHAIRNLGIVTVSWNYIIIPIILKKLDNETLRLYEMSIPDPTEMPTLEYFLSFLERRFQALEATKKVVTRNIGMTNLQPAKNRALCNQQPKKTNMFLARQTKACLLCNQQHELEHCHQFQRMSTLERSKLIAQNNLCNKCFEYSERADITTHCNKQCLICKGKHHTLMHSNNPRQQPRTRTRVKKTPKPVEPTETLKVTTHLINQYEEPSGTLLATAMVVVPTKTQQSSLLRVLIDPGSQNSFITNEAARQINLPTKKINVEIGGINGAEITTATKLIKFSIKARFSSEFSMEIEALVLPKITRSLPEQHFDSRKWNHLNNLVWADPHYNQPNKVDILLGADYYPNILLNEVVKGNSGEPVAQQTELGWIIFGATSNERSSQVESMVTITDVDNQLKKFWEIEEMQPQRMLTEDEIRSEQHFHQTYQRDISGRYIVRLPFKQDVPPLGSSKQRALARLIQLERRFSIAKDYARDYRECIEDYYDKGHLIESTEHSNNEYYIPHHAVIKTSSTTTKLRVVFDASAKTTNNISINQIQLVGPKLQDDLMSILLRWRKHKIAYTADIEQMYRQIKIHPDDQRYQKILWRSSPDKQLKTYQLTTVTFGMACAPYLAIKTLQQLAADEEKNFPIAAQLARNDFYVDDLLSGTDNLEEARHAQTQVISLLKAGGFKLRKWASNHPGFLNKIDPDLRALGPITFDDEAVKTLGLIWNPSTDTFEFKVNLNSKKEKMTKRKMLSESSKLFDPLGWLAPTLIQAKILMQTLWVAGITWDQKLPDDIERKCQRYYASLPTLEEIKIPRWIRFNTTLPGELHGFCDASEVAYAAVVYFFDRTSNKATLLTSKTRVAPIATKLTLPKLELSGASLLANLVSKVRQDMKLEDTPTYFWTDSMIVLGWVKNKPHKFETFVANRISKIQSISNPSQWFHIRSKDNPADCASRGIDADQLINHNLWWNGPQDVFKQANKITPVLLEDVPSRLELKQQVIGATITTSDNTIEQLYLKHSEFSTIKRVMAYVARFINNCRKIVKTKQSSPTAKELNEATQFLIRNAQRVHFKNEIHQLTNGKGIPNKSTILSLSPFLQDNVLRVGGRMQNSTIWTDQQKHPIIIPKKHPIANLLIKEAHEQTMHGGTQLTLAHLRNRYWIVHGRNLTRQVISNCMKCYRFNTRVQAQRMGNLPTVRITPGRPFLRTGVDYAGPFLIRTTKGRGHKAYKGYLAIFVCMTTKAIHIEPVSELTTEAFIAAYKRFVSRRGLCSDLYSDNGTNFVGAKNKLERELSALLQKSSKEMAHLLADDGTTWHFIPPASPHFGGLWEAAVASMKKHLIKVVGEATLTFEELSTVTSQIEACLNSRPLAPITSDPTDVTFLTPGHFLIGTSLRALPQDTIEDISIHGISRWRLIEKIKQDFWKRWQFEYLHQLQHRRKWSTVQSNLNIGDLVLIKDDNVPPLKWMTGRIVEVHTGIDQMVRVVSLRGPGGVLLKRPIHKLAPLPCSHKQLPIKEPQIEELSDMETAKTKHPVRIQPQRKVKQLRTHHHTGAKQGTTIKLALLMIGMGMLQGFLPRVESLTNVEQLPDDAGMYFNNAGTVNLMSIRWTIIINYNLTGYWEDIRALDYYLTYLNESCQKGWEIDKTLKLCDVIVQQLNEQMKEITSQNQLLRTTNKEHIIRRRDIGDTIGYILGDAFGIMNQRDATHIENQLRKAETNEEYLLNLIRNQTSIIDATKNVLKNDRELNDNHFRAIARQFLYLDKRTVKLAADSDHYSRVQAILTFTVQLMLIMRRIADKQRVIIDVILSSHRGHIHPALLSPQQLRDEIQRIHDYAPPTMKIPDGDHDNDLGYIYNLLTVRTRVTANNIIFQMKLPLAYTQLYQLYEVIPIPMLVDKQIRTIQLSTEYLIIDLHREHYAPLTSRDVQRCVQVKVDGYLCNISPVYNTQSNKVPCEIKLLKNKKSAERCPIAVTNKTNQWTQLNTNQWIFTVIQPTPVDLICNNQVTTMTIRASGIMTLDPQCMLRHDEFLLTTVEEKVRNINLSIMASFRISEEEPTQPSSSEPAQVVDEKGIGYDSAFTKLEMAINQQKSDEGALPEIMEQFNNGHHIHHYISIYSLLAISIIVMLTWLYRRNRTQRSPPQTTAIPEVPIPRPRSLILSGPQYVQPRA